MPQERTQCLDRIITLRKIGILGKLRKRIDKTRHNQHSGTTKTEKCYNQEQDKKYTHIQTGMVENWGVQPKRTKRNQ